MQRVHNSEKEDLIGEYEKAKVIQTRSAETIAELMKPVQEKFREFSEAVKESQEKTMERHNKLEQKIVDLDARSRTVSDEARNLANALTGPESVIPRLSATPPKTDRGSGVFFEEWSIGLQKQFLWENEASPSFS